MEDEASYVEFVSARWAALYRLAYLLTADPTAAEDLLQTSLMKTYAAWHTVAKAAAPEAYVRTIIANTLISGRRRKSAQLELVRADVPDRSVESHETRLADRAELWPHIQLLPVRQRAVIVLRYYEDLSEAQIAAALGCSVGTVKSQASDALRRLRRCITTENAKTAGPER